MSEFDPLGFTPNYSVEVNPEFPGNGIWGCPVFGFASDGSATSSLESRWGPPSVVRLKLTSSAWVGMFAAGSLGGTTCVNACPNPDSLLVAAAGLAYVVDVTTPESGAAVLANGVQQVAFSSVLRLLLLVRDLDIIALGGTGIEWRTPRLAVDDLRITAVSSTRIVCTRDNLGGSETIELDLRTGEQAMGTRLSQIWPPGALA